MLVLAAIVVLVGWFAWSVVLTESEIPGVPAARP